MTEIRIDKITIEKLHKFSEFALSDKENFRFIPISPQRAIAQSKNPDASKDDIGLLVVYDGPKCIGYTGLVPCRLRVGTEVSKIFAHSTFYIDPAYRGKPARDDQTIAEALMQEVLNLENDFLSTGISEDAVEFFLKRKEMFKPVGPLSYLRINIGRVRIFSTFVKKLQSKVKYGFVHQMTNRLMKFCKSTKHSLILHLLYPSCKYARSEIIFQEVAHVSYLQVTRDTQISGEDIEANKGLYLYRDENVINWMIANPWITNDREISSEYHFATLRDQFRYLAYNLSDASSGHIIGYVVFSISTENGYTTLKILDYKVSDDRLIPAIFKHALDISINHIANVIECSSDFRRFIQNKTLLRMITSTHERVYFAGISQDSIIKAHNYNICLDYCDCDKPYT
ncbi:MAG: hypothetical protein HQ568_12010 [Calditrichaeota bacterium]|nr:hypothetical protein [Calditrichota bacterium]